MVGQPKRPRRQRKADRLLVPGATADEIRCDYALAPLDRAATEAERLWGIDRLPELVSPETAARYGSAMAKLNAAIDANDPDEVAARAGVCIRGLAALDAEARQRGHQPLPPEWWEISIDGETWAVVRETQDWPQIAATRPDVPVLTLREAVMAVLRERGVYPPEADPAVPARPLTPMEAELEDQIPW